MNDQDLLLSQWFEDADDLTEKQKQILLAAIDSFSEKGYAATSTSEIAKKAGVAEGTIFRHYKTKKDLLMAIVAPTMARFLAPFIIKDISRVINTDYPCFEDFLKAMVENRKNFIQQNLSLFKIMLQELPFQPELQIQFKTHILPEVYERMKGLIIHYQAKGEIIELPPYSVVRLIASTIFGYLIGRYMLFTEVNWDEDAEIERTIQFIMHGLAAKA
ncbi:TetR/AcrR family transcriptional regulator [Bacillus sp. DNRA2]|uniref:TetR/AcrR family transcriptional regulator n=1 Tax=Bacillus sp. DNRA2 TaxID=2723053 RepID=UPI00145F4D9E|nr:TetR/AcrR family transcriptional regulator [Bacillus sp. DNRA2]NMD72347.1 TetR/AcrR family transcriptional regulator [Bacillus sp. DNRA2]